MGKTKKFIFFLVMIVMLLFHLVACKVKTEPELSSEGQHQELVKIANINKVDIHYSYPTGLYSGAVTVGIEGKVEKGKIHYTLDGSVPTAKSPVYTEPITLEESIVIRASVLTDKGVSPPMTATYLIGDSYSLPIFSLVSDPENLWSEEKGIYILGNRASSTYPYKGANYWQDWRVPVEIDYIERGKSVYKATAGLEIFGGETRTLPQKSLAFYAKKEYGHKTFEYPLFPEKPIDEYKTFVLRNGGQDFSKTHMLDGLVTSLIKETKIDYQAYRPVNVFLNGVYWGIHDLREKIDDDFLAANHGVRKKEINLLEANAVEKEGKNEDYLQLIEFIHTHTLSNEENYRHVLKQIDIENFMDYVITELYIANTDWPSHNIRFWKADTPMDKWRWILYDSDLSFEEYEENTVARLFAYKGKGDDALYISFLFRELMRNETFRSDFFDRADYHVKNTFQPDRVIREIQLLKKQLQPDMVNHLKKWGGTMAEWEENVSSLERFAQKRPEYLMAHLQELYETLE